MIFGGEVASASPALVAPDATFVSADTQRQSPRRPRILHLVLASFRGGAEEHTLALLRALPSHGYRPYLALPTQLLQEIKPDLVHSEVETIGLQASTVYWPRLVTELARILKKEQIDLVHCHSVFGTLCSIPASFLSESPAIVETNHGREFWREGKRLKGSFWLDRQSSRFVDKYIAVSHATAQFLSATKGIPSNKIVVIHNGRDLTSLAPPSFADRVSARAELSLESAHAMLLLGRLSIEKGHALLLEALNILRSRQPRLMAMFAGVGPLEDPLKALSNRLGLAARVRFLGYRSDLSRLLAASDLVVLPSISEGLPLAAVEALASARPLIATRVGGIPEIVIDGQTGLLVPPNDPAALAQAIDRVLGNPNLGTYLGMNGRRFVEQHFDVRLQTARTVTLYRELLHERKQRLQARNRRPARGKWRLSS